MLVRQFTRRYDLQFESNLLFLYPKAILPNNVSSSFIPTAYLMRKYIHEPPAPQPLYHNIYFLFHPLMVSFKPPFMILSASFSPNFGPLVTVSLRPFLTASPICWHCSPWKVQTKPMPLTTPAPTFFQFWGLGLGIGAAEMAVAVSRRRRVVGRIFGVS